MTKVPRSGGGARRMTMTTISKEAETHRTLVGRAQLSGSPGL